MQLRSGNTYPTASSSQDNSFTSPVMDLSELAKNMRELMSQMTALQQDTTAQLAALQRTTTAQTE